MSQYLPLIYSLTKENALRRFQSNQLHDDDRYWHAVVPQDIQHGLNSKEQARQKEIFGIIASEQLYVGDLEIWLKVSNGRLAQVMGIRVFTIRSTAIHYALIIS